MTSARHKVYKFIAQVLQLMQSPYYKSTSQGYVLTHRQAPSDIDPSRRIPVYRVVNEFMNLDQHQQPPTTQNKRPNNRIYVDLLSQKEQKCSQQNKVKRYLSRNVSKEIQKEEVKSIQTIQQLPLSSNSKMACQRSMKNFNSSEIKSFYNNQDRRMQSETKTEVITEVESSSHQLIIKFELQKERILRQNLQKSYQNLLNTLRERETVFTFHDSKLDLKHLRNYSQPSTDRIHNITNEDSKQQSNKEVEQMKRRKSCCSLKDSKDHIQQGNENNHLQYSERLTQFQGININKLRQQMLTLQMRIEEVDSQITRKENLHLSIKQQEKRIEIELQNQLLKEKLKNEVLKSQAQSRCNSISQDNNAQARKYHTQYIFTIFMLFLCLAMALKSKQ